MKKTLLITAMLAAMCVGVANAQFVPGASVGQPEGLNMSWQQCDASLGSTGLNQAPTCASNSTFAGVVGTPFTSRVLMASFIYPAVMTSLSATDMLVDFDTAPGPGISCWWNFSLSNPFRAAAISLNLTSDVDGNCGDYWITMPSGVPVLAFSRLTPHPTLGASAMRLDLVAAASAVEGAAAVQPAPGDEVHNFTLRITPAASLGAACPGCLTAACVSFQQTILYRNDGPPVKITNPSTRKFAQWRGGVTFRPGICDLQVPTESKTWGSVKTLYR